MTDKVANGLTGSDAWTDGRLRQGRAPEDGVMMTPALVLVSSDQPKRIGGDLCDPPPVLQSLELGPDE